MERIKNLNTYQKAILLVLLVMILVFVAVYSRVTARIGYLYNDKIFVCSEENGNTLYTAAVDGNDACFTVTPDQTVTLRHGEKLYGPYTVKTDPTAIPKNDELSDHMTGIEIRCGEEILFRGGIMDMGGDYPFWWMVNEDGSGANLTVTAVMSNGLEIDEDGQIIDPMEPSASDILTLIAGPELTHKGLWIGWVGGVILSVMTAVSILFADELFRWNLAFRIRGVDRAEPSEWEIASRYVSWTALTVMTLVLYIMGLQ